MSKWLLVRHGETTWNALGKIQGHEDVKLSEVGRHQAEQLKNRLSGVNLDAAFSSDLTRCVETAQIVTTKAETQLSLTGLMREQGFGSWQGLGFQEVKTQDPDLYDRMMGRDPGFTPPGGESYRDVVRRVNEFSRILMLKDYLGMVLIVGHAGSLRALISSMLKIPLGASWRLQLDSCGLSVLDVGQEKIRLSLFNDTSHRDLAIESRE